MRGDSEGNGESLLGFPSLNRKELMGPHLAQSPLKIPIGLADTKSDQSKSKHIRRLEFRSWVTALGLEFCLEACSTLQHLSRFLLHSRISHHLTSR